MLEWLLDNWGLIASLALNLCLAMGWKKAAKIIRVIIGGVNTYVQETGNTRVEKAIKAESEKAGTEKALKPIVRKVKNGG